MRTLVVTFALALIAFPASAQLQSVPPTTTVHAVVLPAGSCISSPFGPRILPNRPQAGTFHNGVDLPAPEGTPVRAVASGRMLRIETGGPGGLEVLIQHNGYVSVYSHLASVAPSLGKGVIAAGDEIGVVGHTGVSFGPHLFFALLENGRAVDPRPFLGVSMCDGTSPRQRTPSDILAAGEKLPPTRQYYLLSDFPAAHHSQARSVSTNVLCISTDALPSTGDTGPHRVSCTLHSW
jgi:murein DD-endopeptidase MepM/ murein hydrolase activator NlpD